MIRMRQKIWPVHLDLKCSNSCWYGYKKVSSMKKKIELKFNNSGFTLVELSIVLVIMGLIVASVVAGKDLIKGAEMRALIRQYNEFQTAVTTFGEKYNGLPGDINGGKFGLVGGCDNNNNGGNNNGIIEDSHGGNTLHDGEVSCFWSDLTTPGKELVAGAYDGNANADTGNDIVALNLPKMKNSNLGWGVYSSLGKNYFITGVVGDQKDDAYLTNYALVPVDAYNVDVKIDDGVPTSGTVQARGSSKFRDNTPDIIPLDSADISKDFCVNTRQAPNEYQFTAVAELCNLRFNMPSI